MSRPRIPVVKALFALSRNTCYYAGCQEKLTNPDWLEVNCDIAHIRGEAPNAPRYDPTMTEDDRRGFDNLLLLCPRHHRLVDRLEPDRHPAALLKQMKLEHEARSGDTRWAADEELEGFAVSEILAMARLYKRASLESSRVPAATQPKRSTVTAGNVKTMLAVTFPRRRPSPPSVVAQFVEELQAAGYSNIRDVKNDLQKGTDIAVRWFGSRRKRGKRRMSGPTQVRLARIALAITSPPYRRSKYGGTGFAKTLQDDLKRLGYGGLDETSREQTRPV